MKLLRECDCFVIGFDETEVNKISEMEVLVKIAHIKHGIQLHHYRTLDLENGTAPTIAETILDALKEDLIERKC